MLKKEIYLVCTVDDDDFKPTFVNHCAFTNESEAEDYCKKLDFIRDGILETECPINIDSDNISLEDRAKYAAWAHKFASATEQGSAFIRIITLYEDVYDEE